MFLCNYIVWILVFTFECLYVLFIFFLAILARIPNTLLNTRSVRGHDLDFNRNACSISLLNMMVVSGFLKISFIRLRLFHCFPSLPRYFIMDACWILLKLFSFIAMITWFLSFCSMMLQTTLIDFCKFELNLHFGNKPQIQVMSYVLSYISYFALLIYCLGLFVFILVNEIER